MSRCVVVLSVSAFIIMSAWAAPIPRGAEKPKLYYPTKVGTKLVYGYEGDKHESVEVVMESEEENGTTLVTVGHQSQGKLVTDSVVSASEKGLCVVETSVGSLHEPMWLLKLPYVAGSKWDVVVAPVTFDVKFSGKAVAEASEQVIVPAGTFNAIRVKLDMTVQERREVITTWYAPDLGKVKEVRGDRTEVLRSYTLGKD